MNDEELKRHEAKRIRIKGMYQAIKDTDGIKCHLAWLDDMALQERHKAGAYLSDAYGRSIYLQNSLVYENVKAHLLEMFKDDVNPLTK
jgi:hypothetical protein